MRNLTIVSVGIFALMIGAGYLCQFLEASAFSLIAVYALCSVLLHFKKYPSSCIALKAEDFLIVCLLLFIMGGWCIFLAIPLSLDMLAYVYLSAFLAYINYACGMRFRSLF